MTGIYAVVTIGVLLIGALVVFLWLAFRRFKKSEEIERAAGEAAARIEEEANQRARGIVQEGKDQARGLRRRADEEYRQRRGEIQRLERRLDQREQALEQRTQQFEKVLQGQDVREQQIEEREKRAAELMEERMQALEEVSSLTREQAKQVLLSAIEQEIRLEGSKLIRQIEEESRREGVRRAQSVIAEAIQKCAVDQSSEISVSVVSLPDDEMKGRVIGREGRNIRSFEQLTGVTLIIDDTPGAAVISSFDPKRREVARLTLEMLVADGRIHPARIEESYARASSELQTRLREAAEAAILETGVSGLPEEIVQLLGDLKLRTSYGQNVLRHSIEVAFLVGNMASQLGLNAALARRAGLLHDIGKAVDAYQEGTHQEIGAELLRRCGEPDEVVLAAATHHDTPQPNVLAVLVQSADAISASRPGARREMLETYIRRLEQLEELAESFEGVERTYAIQAGREIRVIVEPEQIDDMQAARMARDIVSRIEAELQYPGQIKVVVIRETKAVEFAK